MEFKCTEKSNNNVEFIREKTNILKIELLKGISYNKLLFQIICIIIIQNILRDYFVVIKNFNGIDSLF